MKPTIAEYLEQVASGLRKVDAGKIAAASALLRHCALNNGFVWIIGNGGSAATASHFANDLSKMAGVRSIALTDQTPLITAYANDFTWGDSMFRALDSMRRTWPDHSGPDVLVAISCSGRSSNVVTAAGFWPKHLLVVLTGAPEDNKLAGLGAAVTIVAGPGDIRQQEDIHLAICHAIAGELAR